MKDYSKWMFLSTLFLLGCGSQIANQDSRGKNIIAFGDSLTQGVGAPMGKDYPSILSEALGREVMNRGVSGETSEDGLLRLEQDVLSKSPRLVIVCFGGNDFLRRVPWEKTFKNIDEMVRRIQRKGAMVLLIGVRSGLWGSASKKAYKKISKKRQTAFIPDILQGVFGHPSLMSDGIHPNEKGYQQIAERIQKVVEPLLR